MKPSQKLVLFDFDGTITSRDTLFAFAEFISGRFRFLLGLLFLSPVLIGHRLRFIPAQRAKEVFFSYYFRGLAWDEFNEICARFHTHVLAKLIRPEALSTIQQHLTEGSRVVIVSASAENWITPWAQPFSIEVIATQLETVEGKLTGKIKGKNCNNEEKVARIREQIDLSAYSRVIAYGDSSGDKAMFALADQVHFKPFRDK